MIDGDDDDDHDDDNHNGNSHLRSTDSQDIYLPFIVFRFGAEKRLEWVEEERKREGNGANTWRKFFQYTW